jgi:hypothetical protein
MYDVRELRKLSHRLTAKEKLPRVGHIMTEKVTRTGIRHSASPADRTELRNKQNGKCLICAERSAADLDHNWATGAVRGYLCHGCNVMIGHRREDASLLRRLAQARRASARSVRSLLVASRYQRAALYLEVFGHDPRRVTV